MLRYSNKQTVIARERLHKIQQIAVKSNQREGKFAKRRVSYLS